MTAMMMLTCAKAVGKSCSRLPPLHGSSLIAIASWYPLVPDHEDVRSDLQGAVSRSHLGRFSMCGVTKYRHAS